MWDHVQEKGERGALHGGIEGGMGAGKGEGAGAELLAAKDFAAWLVEELGGPDE